LKEHFEGKFPGFTQQYRCHYLIYYELFQFIDQAIAREKELKAWRREKKEMLISKLNPAWIFLNDRFLR
jgi:putative endonuclease